MNQVNRRRAQLRTRHSRRRGEGPTPMELRAIRWDEHAAARIDLTWPPIPQADLEKCRAAMARLEAGVAYEGTISMDHGGGDGGTE